MARRPVVLSAAAVVVFVGCLTVGAWWVSPPVASAAEGDAPASAAVARRRPITIGTVTVHARDVVAVVRPADQVVGTTVYVGRPGQAIQAITIRDAREAAAAFDALWNNNAVTKDPGDDDAQRPLTRMMPKDPAGERRTATLICNVDRVLAIHADPANRVARVFFDKPSSDPLLQPNGQEREFLEIRSVRDEADTVLAAYRASLYTK
jgi:hypothetical protein